MTGPILVFGAGGQVGQALMALAEARDADPVGMARTAVDITDETAVLRTIAAIAPRLVVNAAAFTGVDLAEDEPALAEIVNARAAASLARAAARAGLPILHLSTDYVFDGTTSGAYRECDPTGPINVYGWTKLRGETGVRAATKRHVILRTSWLYGAYGHNFVKTMMRLAVDRDRLRVVDDQRGCPTATLDLAEAILAVDRALANDPTLQGTYHFAGDGTASWRELAEVVVAAQAVWTGRKPPVDPVATKDYPTRARRPANSELDSSHFARTFGYRADPWERRVIQTVDALAASGASKADGVVKEGGPRP